VLLYKIICLPGLQRLINAYLYAAHPITDVVKRRRRRDVIHDQYTVRLAKIVSCEASIPKRSSPQAHSHLLSLTSSLSSSSPFTIIIIIMINHGLNTIFEICYFFDYLVPIASLLVCFFSHQPHYGCETVDTIIHRVLYLFIPPAFADTHCNHPRKDGQAELTRIAGYVGPILCLRAHGRFSHPNTNRARRRATICLWIRNQHDMLPY